MEKISKRIKRFNKISGIKILKDSYGIYISRKLKNTTFEQFLYEQLYIKKEYRYLGKYINTNIKA